MQPQEFLAAVLPSSGTYCAVELTSGKKEHIFNANLFDLEESIAAFDAQHKNTYFALASFDEAHSRKAEHAQYMRAIFVDIDVGKGKKVYGSKKEAVEALMQFLEASGLNKLGMPWLVDSGGGVHVYWPLDADATIAQWKAVANAFKNKAQLLNFKMDYTVTADAARVLRPPGTTNWKYNPPCPVMLKSIGATFSLAAMAAVLEVAMPPAVSHSLELPLVLPGVRPPRQPTSTDLALTQNNITVFKNIMVKTVAGNGCGQLAHYIDNAKEDGMEPLWRGMLSIAQRCVDGEKAAVFLSKLHPYDEDRMRQKLRDIKGPYSCIKLEAENPGGCSGCKHWGKITNPLALGAAVNTETEEKEVVVESADGVLRNYVRPVPPRGFTFGKEGGVYQIQTALDADGMKVKKEVQLVPYDFFRVDTMQEDDAYITRFVAIRKNGERIYVPIPNKIAGSKDDVIKTLGSQNILAVYGANNDKNLHEYVRACIAEASVANASVRVPAIYGWQPDGSFAVCDTVLKPEGKGHTFVSDRLNNLIRVTEARGTTEEWAKVLHMIQAKELWWLLSFSMIGFASPLMRWGDEGAPGIVFHVCGQGSGIGKSMALSMAASVWGPSRKYPVVPTTAERTMLQRAGLLGNLPLLVDEVTTKARESKQEWIPEFVFSFSQGGHKLKGSGSANAELDNNLFWRSMALITSNAPVVEHMMGARDTTSEGEAKRILEWMLPKNQKIEFTDAERDIKDLLTDNYGVVGREWAQWLVDNQERARSVVEQCVNSWRKNHGAEEAERFWTVGCGCIVAACILTGPQHANLCNVNVRAVEGFLDSMCERMRKIIGSNQHDAEDILNAYTRENHGLFVKYGAGDKGIALFSDGRDVKRDSTRGRVAGRIEYDVNKGYVDYYIEQAVMKRYCSLRNWSYTEFVQEMKNVDTYVVSECRKDLLAGTNGPTMRVSCLQLSRQLAEGEDGTE